VADQETVLRCLITFACFAVLCVFALRIGSYSFNTQRKDSKDHKARKGLTPASNQ